MKTDEKDTLTITTDTIGADLLKVLLNEIQKMPQVWMSMNQEEQSDVIERLKISVKSNVQKAVGLINADRKPVFWGHLSQITTKKGIRRATIDIDKESENIIDIYDSVGNIIMVVPANGKLYNGDMDSIKSQPDQQDLL